MNLDFFERYLEDLVKKSRLDSIIPNNKGNVQICCPFPHKKFIVDGFVRKEIEYYEDIPSSSINMDKRCFNCFVCGKSCNELDFASLVTGKTHEEILKEYDTIKELKDESLNWEDNQYKKLKESPDIIKKLYDLKITDSIIDSLKLGYMTNCLAIPIFKHNNLLNVARYNINRIENIPKVRYNENSLTGDIVPFNDWLNDNRNTIICEGEKDMLIARSHGLNAITITGGCQKQFQNEYLDYFKNRIVHIVYDNDEPGKTGALKIYTMLKNICDVYITDISSVCTIEKEDIGDFFIKYNKNYNDFIDLINNNSFKPTDSMLKEIKNKGKITTSKLVDNIENNRIRTTKRSIFQIIATSMNIGFGCYESALFEPKDDTEETELKSKRWFLDDSDEKFLELIEGSVTSNDIPNIIASQCFLPKKWSNFYNFKPGKIKSVFKYTVTDEFHGKRKLKNEEGYQEEEEKHKNSIIDIYTFKRLDIGSFYDIEYKIYPHPKEGQRYIAVAYNIENSENETVDLENNNVIEALNSFKTITSIDNKIKDLYESAKCHIAPYLNKDIWFLMELVFNSPLDMTYKNKIRGALDIFIVGDTRTGKSETAEYLAELYSFGDIIRLKSATTPALIGGTNQTTKKSSLGLLPRLHKGLAILEEFSGAPNDFLTSLTDIRSSNVINLLRVDSELKAPCKLRMITLSNPILKDDNENMISNYPNGIMPLTELIKTAEDIARYDAMMVVPQVEHLTNIFKAVVDDSKKLKKDNYVIKSKWIKMLNYDNVVVDDELGSYIFDKAQELNSIFECRFTLFGSETDKKLARISASLAIMLCSTDDYKNIIITKEHVDYICEFLKSIYDNEIFRLREFANEEKTFKIVMEEDTRLLNKLYPQNVVILNHLANISKANRNELMTVSGLDKNEFNKFINVMASRKFIQLKSDQILPTVKFRKTFKLIDKDINNFDINENTKIEGSPF